MTIFTTVYIFTFFANLFLALLVYFNNRKSILNRLFTLFIICIISWLISLYFYYQINDPHIVLWIGRINFAVSSLMPFVLLEFVRRFPRNSLNKPIKLIHLIRIESILLFFVSIFTPFIARNEFISGESRITEYGILYWWFIVHFLGYTIANIYLLIKKLLKAKGIEKNQIVVFIWGVSFAVIFGSITNIFIPLLTPYSDIQNLGPIATLFLVGATTYSILRTRFLDIRFAIRSVSVKILYIIVLFIISSFGIYIYQWLTGNIVDSRAFILGFILISIYAFIGEYLQKWITTGTDRIFFQQTFTEQEILNELARTMAQSIDINSLTSKIKDAFKKVFHIHYVSFLIFTDDDVVKMGDKIKRNSLDYNHILVDRLSRKKDIIVLDELKILIQDKNDRAEEFQIIEEMTNIDSQVIVPLHGSEKVIGMMVLGEKKSNEAFSTNDIQALETLSYQAGIAIENASLYSEVKSFSKKLQQEIAKATLDLREKNKFLSILRGLDQIIMNTLDLDRMCQKIVDTISWDMGYIGGMIALIDERRHLLQAMAISQTPAFDEIKKILPKNLKQFTISLSEKDNALARAVLYSEEGTFESMTDIFSPVIPKDLTTKTDKKIGIKSNLVYPLSAKGKKLGVVILGLPKEPKQIKAKERELIQAFVDQTGIAIENASLYSDITKTNKELEKANEHLKELDKMKDEFVSIASHELRTPMTAIQGFAWMLQKGKHKARLSTRQRDYLTKIIESTNRLISLVGDMLDVTKIEGGKFSLEMKEEKIENIIKSTIEEIKPKSLEKNIVLGFETSKSNIPSVEIDEKRIREVLLNLIGNAIKFTPVNGRITVSAKKKGKMVQVDVTDSGRGINRQDIPKLFKKFGRLEHSYAMISETSGTGLGLYISKALVEMHGGKISVKSKLNKGSVFTFTLRTFK